jgi:hypothetical protein
MDSKEWLEKEKIQYYNNWDQVKSLFSLTKSRRDSFLDITFTYIAIYNFDKAQTEYFYIFMPYKTGMEKKWSSMSVKLLGKNYSFNNYSNNLPYIYIKDDSISTTQEFYKSIFDTTKDIKVYKYEKLSLKEPIIFGNKPVLHSIEYSDHIIKENTFEEWWKNESSVCDIILKFSNPFRLFWNNKRIVLSSKNSKNTFFNVFLE